ncbi:MAG TPA: DMT family transporter [Dongiaceae bacterium]|nr:DMT family transporter [Dongiaceae bacterium]
MTRSTTLSPAPRHQAPGAKSLRHQDRPIFGILLINLATVIFTAMDAIIKSVSDIFPTGQLVFFRNLFAFAPILIFMMTQRGPGGGISLRTQHLGGHLMRGLFGVSAMYCYFLSYKLLPLSEAIALGLSGPIFLTVLSIPFLGEKVGIRRWSACIVGFLGVLVMTRPGAGVWQSAALVPLLAAVFYALAMISIRRLTGTERSGTIVFYFTAFATLAGLVTLPLGFVWPELAWTWPSDWQFWGIVILIGLMGGVGQILITIAFRCAPVSVVAPFDYMALVYGFILGFMFFSEVPDAYLIVGGLIVVMSGIYIVHRETVVARQRHKAQPAPALPPEA